MATETSTPTDRRRARFVRLACALLALGGATPVVASPLYGPVANFGPAPVVVDAPAPISRPVPDRAVDAPAPISRPVPDRAVDAPAPTSTEARPLLGGKAARPAIVEGAAKPSESNANAPASWPRVLGALAVVVALIFALRGLLGRVAARGGLRAQLGAGGRAPSGVLEVLGRYPVSRGQTLVLLRLDQRVMLLGQSSSGFRTLADFSDPSEVASLLMRTRDEDSESLSGRFRHMLSKFERDPAMTEGVEHVDLTRRSPLIRRAAAAVHAHGAASGVQRVPTSRDSYEAIRRRLDSMKGVTP